ncbi:hypothetical protein O6H91_12G027000 [Diphasiastrum complanatum]|uniref:Uncharacterized protein n=1 Tax=Diphasiastrum complanatum TaxID=34168 RepID=A0ACC2BZV2_DIPCM|nr:hypothetical protein O6H91_12G027000 [Diphasiastrum complanatum]
MQYVKVIPDTETFARFCNGAYCGTLANFLNMTIVVTSVSNASYFMTKYDKRKAISFASLQYILHDANRPASFSYKLILSQILPLLYICFNENEVAAQMYIVLLAFKKNGFSGKTLYADMCSNY